VRTLVHSVEAAIKLSDAHGQSVFIDLLPDGINAASIEVTKLIPQEGQRSLMFMVEVHIPHGLPCPSCGQVHDQEPGEEQHPQVGEQP